MINVFLNMANYVILETNTAQYPPKNLIHFERNHTKIETVARWKVSKSTLIIGLNTQHT